MTDVENDNWIIEWYNSEQYYDDSHVVEAANEIEARTKIAEWLSTMDILELTNRGLANVDLTVTPDSTTFVFDTTEITQQKVQDSKAARESAEEKAERELFERLKKKYEGGKINNDD